jgi:hypothetical protein
MVAVQRVPVFPGRGRKMSGRASVHGGPVGRTGEHARDVWDLVREHVARGAWALERADSVGRARLPGAVDLEFLVRMARHVAGCKREGCPEWTAWAVGQVPELRQVFMALGGTWQQVPPGYARALAAVWRA